MGWLIVVLGGIATYAFYSAGTISFAVLTGTLTAINFWSYGVMHNFAVEAAKRRPDYRGGFGDFGDADLVDVPNWATHLNLGTALLVLALLVWAGISGWP